MLFVIALSSTYSINPFPFIFLAFGLICVFLKVARLKKVFKVIKKNRKLVPDPFKKMILVDNSVYLDGLKN